MAYYRKLGRKTSHRNLMLRNLTTDVLRLQEPKKQEEWSKK